MTQFTSKRKISRWSRRQRKKHHVGEFQELGFALWMHFEQPLDEAQIDAFHGAAMGMFDTHRLHVYGGWGDQSSRVFVVAENGAVSEAQRSAVLEWLQAWPGLAQVRAGELRDAWHGDFTEFQDEGRPRVVYISFPAVKPRSRPLPDVGAKAVEAAF
jgi:uncharacterized protein YggL (DUF469 family)